MFGEVIARKMSDDVFDLLDAILRYYRAASQRHSTRNMRLGVFLRKEGLGRFLRVLGLDESSAA